MDHDHIILGMIDGVGDLRRCQPDIDGVKHRTEHRHSEESLEIAVCVPVHDSNDISRPDTLSCKAGCKPLQPRLKVAVSVAHEPVADDFGVRRNLLRRSKQALDQKREVCGMGRGHGCLSSVGKTVSANHLA